jgi:hypothetical protein
MSAPPNPRALTMLALASRHGARKRVNTALYLQAI